VGVGVSAVWISDADLKRYAETGVLFPIPVLSAAERERFRSEVDELEALAGAGAPRTLFGQCHLNFKWAYDLSTHPRVLDAVERVIGPDILVHSTTLFSKPSGDQFVSWHQDSHYWELSEPRLVSAWIALSDSTIENGCMRVQPGTQGMRLDHTEVRHQDNMLANGSTITTSFDEARAVDVILKAGEMSFHHASVVHGSNPNRSDGKRVGFAIRYVAPEVRQGRGHHAVVLARGRDRYGHYEHVKEAPPHSVRDGLPHHIAFSTWFNQLDVDHAITDGKHER
jgi:ectoine hydroxylase-related dioxygenase (phytanoyl-CoA dioxygenase family)